MKVLHVVPSLGTGGAPLGAIELARCQATRGVEVNIAQITSFQWQPEQFPIHSLGCSWRFGDWSVRRKAMTGLKRLITDLRPDVVHSHLLPADFISANASVGLCGHVSHIRDTQPWLKSRDIRSLMKRGMYRLAFRRAGTQFISVSSAAADYAAAAFCIPRQSIRVVLNGISLAKFRTETSPHNSRSTFNIGAAGRLSNEKGHAVLVRAVASLAEAHPSCQLFLAGSGSQESALRALVAEHGLNQTVRFCGDVENMSDWFQQLDVLVVPSLGSEGLARVILEALCHGIPVIATDVSGSSEVIRDGVNGFLIPPGDSEAIRNRLAELIDSPQRRSEMAGHALSDSRLKFSVERVESDVRLAYAEFGWARPSC